VSEYRYSFAMRVARTPNGIRTNLANGGIAVARPQNSSFVFAMYD